MQNKISRMHSLAPNSNSVLKKAVFYIKPKLMNFSARPQPCHKCIGLGSGFIII